MCVCVYAANKTLEWLRQQFVWHNLLLTTVLMMLEDSPCKWVKLCCLLLLPTPDYCLRSWLLALCVILFEEERERSIEKMKISFKCQKSLPLHCALLPRHTKNFLSLSLSSQDIQKSFLLTPQLFFFFLFGFCEEEERKGLACVKGKIFWVISSYFPHHNFNLNLDSLSLLRPILPHSTFKFEFNWLFKNIDRHSAKKSIRFYLCHHTC